MCKVCDSIATMLGWMHTPPQDVLERDVSELKRLSKEGVQAHLRNEELLRERSELKAELHAANEKLKIPHPARDFVNEFNVLLAAKDRAMKSLEENLKESQAIIQDERNLSHSRFLEIEKLKKEVKLLEEKYAEETWKRR